MADHGYILHSKLDSGGGKPVPELMIGAMINITRRKQEEVRTKFLIDFGEQLRPLSEEEVLFEKASRLLGEYLKVDRCNFFEIKFATRQLTHHKSYSKVTAMDNSAEIHSLPDLEAVEELKKLRPVIINDSTIEKIPDRFYRELYQSQKLRAILIVPLAEQRREGSMLMVSAEHDHQLHQWQTEEIDLVKLVLERVWLAAQNARLYQKAKAAAVLEERNRIARDLHDSLQQDFYFIQLQANTILTILNRETKTRSAEKIMTHLNEILLQAEGGIAGLRTLIFDLRSETITRQGLVAGLLTSLESLKVQNRLKVSSFLGPEPTLRLEIKEALYWIAREALHNIIKHAGATQVELTLFQDKPAEGLIELSIKDNGHGFNPEEVGPAHLGLQSMQERANQYEGNLRISSQVGQGTTVVAIFPMVK